MMNPRFHRLVLLLCVWLLVLVSAARTRGGRRGRSHPSPAPTAAPAHQSPNIPVHNWGYAYEFNVTKVVTPLSAQDIVAVVRDPQAYPSPVRALGNIHSVTACVVSNGTIVNMLHMNKIVGMLKDERGRQTVAVEAGVTLIELHRWLAAREMELPFAAEIGDATIGSLASSISKDSGVGDPALSGTLYKSIVGVTYVDHRGEVVTLKEDAANATQLAAFKSSDGLWGIVVAVDLLVRPAKLLSFSNHVWPTEELMAKFAETTFQVTPSTNYWILLNPEYSLLQERTLAPPGATETDPETLGVIVNATRASFAKGVVAVPLAHKSVGQAPLKWTTYKHKMVNHYGPLPVPVGNATVGPRLDFTWFEYPLERFQEVVYSYLVFWTQFKDAHNGFEPAAAATYFVERIPDKPHGWFSMNGEGFDRPGLSFTLDPVYHDPNDPLWQQFLEESVAFARKHGGRTALTQTRFLTREDFVQAPGNVAVTEAPNGRFTSAYFAQFLEEESAGAASTTKVVKKNVV